jgi:hypothetical protein
MRMVLAASVFPVAAAAQDVVHIGPPMIAQQNLTSVILQETDKAGAVAEVIFDNRDVNGVSDNRAYPLSIDGLSVEIVFTYTAGADSIEIIPEDGFYAVPPVLDMPEGTVGIALIFSGEWEGM